MGEPGAKWPPGRVTIQPPSVEYSTTAGKWRSVSRARAAVIEPRADHRLDARRLRGLATSSTRSSARMSIVTAPEYPRPRAARHRPPRSFSAERDGRAPASAHHPSTLDLGLLARARDDVRHVVELPAHRATMSR